MRTLLAPVFWLGRVTLWVLFFPLGWWRSARHGRKQSEKRVIDAMRENQR